MTNTFRVIEHDDGNFPCLHTWGLGFPGGSVVKNLPANAGNAGSIPELGRFPGEGNGNPLQYSWPEKPGGLQSMGLQRVRSD